MVENSKDSKRTAEFIWTCVQSSYLPRTAMRNTAAPVGALALDLALLPVPRVRPRRVDVQLVP
eukprot:1500909-Rhodomonas_salina.2